MTFFRSSSAAVSSEKQGVHNQTVPLHGFTPRVPSEILSGEHLFGSLDDQIARIIRMKASIFFVIRAGSGPRFCSRQIPLKNVTIKPARESLSSRDPRAAARLAMSS